MALTATQNNVAENTNTTAQSESSNYPFTWEPQHEDLPGQGEAWLQSLRQAAAGHFAEQGMPAKGLEDWKYSHHKLRDLQRNLRPLAPVSSTKTTEKTTAQAVAEYAEGWRIVLLDGQLDVEQSELDSLPAGIRLLSMADALADAPIWLQEQLGKIATSDERALTALNLAWLNSGLVMQVAKGTVLSKPIIIEQGFSEQHVINQRLFVHVESLAEVELIERYVGGAEAWVNTVSEFKLEEGASLRHSLVQMLDNRAHITADVSVAQARDSRFRTDRFELGANFARCELHVAQQDKAAETQLNGLMMPKAEQHHDLHTWIEHEAPHGISRELVKAVLDDKAEAVFNGMVRVYRDAQKVDSEQHNHNLLLSREAEINTKPELEIYADDVQCAHGATVGELDRRAMFYLRSRGIDEAAAEAILTWAFAAEMVERVQHEPLKNYLIELIAERMQADQYHD